MPITLFTGPMYSGKTIRLIDRLERHTLRGERCVAIGWKEDNRYTKTARIVSHNKASWACKKLDNQEFLNQINDIIAEYDVICIDEGCFFLDIVKICERLSDAGKTVYVSSLVSTYERKPFGDICNLIPICSHIEFLRAICGECNKENASFTHLIKKELKSAVMGSAELIGSTEKYISLCDACFRKLNTV